MLERQGPSISQNDPEHMQVHARLEQAKADLPKFNLDLSPEVLFASTFDPLKTSPESFLGRLLETYSRPEQQAYICGMWGAITAGTAGMEAAMRLAQEQEPSPHLEEYFPASANAPFVRSANDPDFEKSRVVMERDKASKIIRDCNRAALVLEQVAQKELEDERQRAGEVIMKGKFSPPSLAKLPGHLLGHIVWAIEKRRFGEEESRRIVRGAMKRIITRDRHLPSVTADHSAGNLRAVSRMLNEPYNPFEALKYAFSATVALPIVGIWQGVTVGIENAISHEFEMESTLSS